MNELFSGQGNSLNNERDFTDETESKTQDYFLNLAINLNEKNLHLTEIRKIIDEAEFSKDSEVIHLLLDLYDLYLEILKNCPNKCLSKIKIKLKQFFEMTPEEIFNRDILLCLSKMSSETFNSLTEQILRIIHNEKLIGKINAWREMLYIPIIIIDYLIKEKAPLKIISNAIQLCLKFRSDKEREQLVKYILKIIFENYTDNIQNNMLIAQILQSKLDSLVSEQLEKDLKTTLSAVEVFLKHKISFSLLDLVFDEYQLFNKKLKLDQSKIKQKINEFLLKITRSFKNSEFNFIDKYNDDIRTILFYLERFNSLFETNLVDILLSFLKENKFEHYSIKILLNNNKLKDKIDQIQQERLINVFIEAHQTLKENEIADYLYDLQKLLEDDIASTRIDKTLRFRLTNLEKFYRIRQVFTNNSIVLDFQALDYENLNVAEILEVFIARKFNIDNISSLEGFLSKTKDISEALGLEQSNLLYQLFFIFYKYQKIELCVEILDIFTKSDYSKFEEIIDFLKKKTKDLHRFTSANNFGLKMVENTNNYEMLLENVQTINFKNYTKIRFNLENEDMFTLVTLKESIIKDKMQMPHKALIENLSEPEANDTKTNFLNFCRKISSKNTETQEQSSFKYSLHPDLLHILNSQRINITGKEFKYTTNLFQKCKLYQFLLMKNSTSLDQVLKWENFEIQKLNTFKEEELFNFIKILMNLYNGDLQNVKEFDKLFYTLKSHVNPKILDDLINFYLRHFKYLNVEHAKVINKLTEDDNYIIIENEHIRLYTMLNQISNNKFNILPFVKLKAESKVNLSVELGTLYSDNLINLDYFKTSNARLADKFKEAEIFKQLTMNNWINFKKIFCIIHPQNIEFLLVLKISHNHSIFSALIYDGQNSSRTELTKLASRLPESQIKAICSEILELPYFSYLMETGNHLMFLNKNIVLFIRNYLTNKLVLIEEILRHFPYLLTRAPLVFNKLKIFRVKHYILLNVPENDTKAYYDKMQHIEDFGSLDALFSTNKNMKKELYRIYTAQLSQTN